MLKTLCVNVSRNMSLVMTSVKSQSQMHSSFVCNLATAPHYIIFFVFDSIIRFTNQFKSQIRFYLLTIFIQWFTIKSQKTTITLLVRLHHSITYCCILSTWYNMIQMYNFSAETRATFTNHID